MNLYSTHAKDFSQTRQSPWLGWERVAQLLDKNKELSVLDLGCGNGRFLKFLLANDVKVSSYTGIDSSQEMLEIAKAELQDIAADQKFIKANLNSFDVSELGQSYDLIVGFGLMHHLETNAVRDKLIQESIQILNPKGNAVFTFWQFMQNERLKSKIKKDLGNNDYILSFGAEGTRFCHYSDPLEVSTYLDNHKTNLVETYFSDGENNNLNYYVILQQF